MTQRDFKHRVELKSPFREQTVTSRTKTSIECEEMLEFNTNKRSDQVTDLLILISGRLIRVYPIADGNICEEDRNIMHIDFSGVFWIV